MTFAGDSHNSRLLDYRHRKSYYVQSYSHNRVINDEKYYYSRGKKQPIKIIHQLEFDEAIHLTRHGKPVAVMLSEANYQKLIQKGAGLFQAIQRWRSQLDSDSALTEAELKQLRAAGQEREFSWDE
jgi:hypothetical protein